MENAAALLASGQFELAYHLLSKLVEKSPAVKGLQEMVTVAAVLVAADRSKRCGRCGRNIPSSGTKAFVDHWAVLQVRAQDGEEQHRA